MINVLLSGAGGNMGQVITKLSREKDDIRVAVGYDVRKEQGYPYPVYDNLNDITEDFDVIIDFSHPNAFDGLLAYGVEKKKPLVMATTGLSQEQSTALVDASKKIPIFRSANMSLGINLLVDLVKKSSLVLGDYFDIEIIEKHHNQKVDAPSGTAYLIADSINSVFENEREYVFERKTKTSKRDKKEIGIHAVRGGTIVGEHSVIFAGKDEILEIKHTACSKEIFAVGAIKAACFIAGKTPGMYSMTDLVL